VPTDTKMICPYCKVAAPEPHKKDCPQNENFKAQKFSPIATMDQLLHENAVLKAALCCVLADGIGSQRVVTMMLDRDKYRDFFPNGAKVAIRDDAALWAVRIEKL
jgi:hypothetical protein